MVEGVKRAHAENPKKLLLEAKDLLESIKEASSIDNELPYIEVSSSRTRLRDIYRALLIENLEVALDQKIEQDLWNQCYKNPINQLQEKQKSKSTKAEIRQEALHNLTELLEGAYGFYLRLLDEICEVYELELPNRATERQLKMMPNIVPRAVKEPVAPRTASSRYIAQHCLVHLGDIARYRHKHNMADSYYRKAAVLVPSNGQPYNQLAILSAGSSDMLQTVFLYFRAMHVKCPFPGSQVNLERALDKVLKSSKSKTQKQISKISVLELIRIFLKFHAACYQQVDDKEDFAEMEQRLIGAIEVHLSLGGLSRRQLLQMTFISIVNLHRSNQSQNASFSRYLLDFVLSFLDLLIRPPVDPSRHLPSVLSILQFIDQNVDYLKSNKSRVWPQLSVMLNRTLPASWGSSWTPQPNPLPEDIEFRGWTMWKIPNCIDINNNVTTESDQTDARAERILYISRKIALSQNDVLLIDFETQNGQFSSKVQLEDSSKFVKKKEPEVPSPTGVPVGLPPGVVPNIQSPVFIPQVISGPNTGPPPVVSPPRPEDLPRPQFVDRSPVGIPPPPLGTVQSPPPVRVHGSGPTGPAEFKGPVLRPIMNQPPPFPPGGPPMGPRHAPRVGSMPPPPPGMPPPGMAPPQEIINYLPPDIMNILRHIPPPAIPQNTSPTIHKDVGMAQFPPVSQMYAKEDKKFPPSPFVRMFPPPPIRSSPINPTSGSNGPSPPVPPTHPTSGPIGPGPEKASYDRFRMNPSPEVFVPGHRKRPSTPGGIPFEAPPWNQGPGSGDNGNAPIGSNRPRIGPHIPPTHGNDQNHRNFQNPQNNQSLFFPTSSFSTPKPVIDPDSYDRNSYDRKIQSVSEFWDPASPRGVGAPSREIWAPIRPQSPLDTMSSKFLESLPDNKNAPNRENQFQ